MAQVLTSFLVGIGADVSGFQKGQKEVERGLVNIRSTALASGAALVGVFGAAAKTAAGVQDMAVATQGLRASVADVQTYAGALRTVGGNSEQALADLTALDKMAAQMRMGQFDVTGLIKWGVTGDEVEKLRKATGPMEQMQILADIVPRLKPMNRNMVMGELGISNESMVLLAKGQQDYNKALADAQAAINTSVMPQLIEQSAQFTDQMGQLQNTMIGIGNTMATAVLPGMTDFLGRLDDLAKEVAPAAEQAADVISRNTGPVAAMAAGATLTVTPLAPLGWLLMAAGFGTGAGNEIDRKASQGKLTPYGDQADPYFNESKRDLTRTEQSIWQAAPVQYDDYKAPVQYDDYKAPVQYDDYKAAAYNESRETQALMAMYSRPKDIDYKRLGAEVAASMRGVELKNNVTVELDGQVIGASVENHMQRSSEQVVESLSGGIAR